MVLPITFKTNNDNLSINPNETRYSYNLSQSNFFKFYN